MERENTIEECYVLGARLPPNIPREAVELIVDVDNQEVVVIAKKQNKIPVLQQQQHQQQQQQQQQDDVNTESNVILDDRILKITQRGSAIQIEAKKPVVITFRETVGKRRRGHSGESGDDDDDSPPPSRRQRLQDQDETSAANATTNEPGNCHADKPESNQGCRSGGRCSTQQQTTNNCGAGAGEATTLQPCSVVLERALESEPCSFATVHNKDLAAHRAEHHKASEDNTC